MAIGLLSFLDGAAEARFWAKVRRFGPDDCWPWTAFRNPKGYGQFMLGGRPRNAQRVALTLHLAHDLAPNELACHRCDNPPCCNPAHLFVATPAENSRDMRRKRRSASGERHSQAKLSNSDVAAIRALAGTMTQREIGEMFGVRPHTISRILSGTRRAAG